MLPLVFVLFLCAAHAVVLKKCSTNGVFALTYDEGPATFTNQLLATLNAHKVKATFHLSTQNLLDPDVQEKVRKIHNHGHLIGIRTEPDWDLQAMSDDQIKGAISRQASSLRQFCGYTPKLFRLPYKKYDDRVLKAVESAGGVVTEHNLDSYDYTNDPKRIENAFNLAMSLKSASGTSFISVQHDESKESVQVTSKVIEAIKKKGYKLVTLDECLGLGNLRQNKTPLKGGNGSDEDLPMLKGGSGGKLKNKGGKSSKSEDAADLTDDVKGPKDKKQKRGLFGMTNAASQSVKAGSMLVVLIGTTLALAILS